MNRVKWKIESLKVVDVLSNSTVFKLDEIESASVIYNVVRLHNEGKNLMDIDDYLLNEEKCTQDEREDILEQIYEYSNTEIGKTRIYNEQQLFDFAEDVLNIGMTLRQNQLALRTDKSGKDVLRDFLDEYFKTNSFYDN